MAKIQTREEIELHNNQVIEKAIQTLDRVMRERRATKTPGAVGVRISFNRDQFGAIHIIQEDRIQ